MPPLLNDRLTGLDDLEVRAQQSDIVSWQGRQALRLENGLALVRDLRMEDGIIEVMIGTDGPAYPGIAFRVADVLNYELAYAVPHVSGQWDALQYDPVFLGSNTWQLYHGPGYQQTAQVPTGRWFALRVAFCGQRAILSVDGQPPLVVERLAREVSPGQLGLWTFRPAYFSDLRVSRCQGLDVPSGEMAAVPEGAVDGWFVEGYGVLPCEPHGLLNLNRYLPVSLGEVRLIRRFEMAESGIIRLDFGFSDALSLELDDEVVFSGENTFQGFADRAARGYVEPGHSSVQRALETGTHCLAATLKVNEGFGWGLVLATHGQGSRWLPAELG